MTEGRLGCIDAGDLIGYINDNLKNEKNFLTFGPGESQKMSEFEFNPEQYNFPTYGVAHLLAT